MAGRSKWERFKPEVWEAFREGKKPQDVIEDFGLPSSTAYSWYREFASNPGMPGSFQDNSKIIPESTPKLVPTTAVIPTEIIEPPVGRAKVIPIEGAEQMSDFSLARRTLRAIAKNPNQPGAAIGVRAAVGLIKLCELRNEIPQHVLDEVETTSLDDECSKLENLSEEELSRLYQEKIRSG